MAWQGAAGHGKAGIFHITRRHIMSNRHVKKAKESVTIALRAGARVAGGDPEKIAAELGL